MEIKVGYKIREDIEVMPLGNGKFLVRDTSGYTEKTILIDELGVLIISMLDGKKTEKEIQLNINSLFRINVDISQIQKIISTLKENGFLESPEFFRIKEKAIEEFRLSVLREARHKDKSYPSNPSEAEKFVEGILELGGKKFEEKPKEKLEGKVIGILSPHIEVSIGARVYGNVWKSVAEKIKGGIFVIFGTCHAFSKNPLILTQKSFETPFGILKNSDITRKLVEKWQGALYDEFLHKNEHSIEFQTLFIKYLFKDAEIIPILVSAYEIYNGKKDSEFLDILFEEIKNENFVIVSGSDLAHIGTRFGDEPVTNYDVSLTRIKDMISLKAFAEVNSEKFLKSIMYDMNRRKVCGLGPTYYALKILEKLNPQKGYVLDWDIWIDETLSAVSYGGAILTK